MHFNEHRISVTHNDKFWTPAVHMSISLTILLWTLKRQISCYMFFTTIKKRGKERGYLIQLPLQRKRMKFGKSKQLSQITKLAKEPRGLNSHTQRSFLCMPGLPPPFTLLAVQGPQGEAQELTVITSGVGKGMQPQSLSLTHCLTEECHLKHL